MKEYHSLEDLERDNQITVEIDYDKLIVWF